jgi:hypothetical protein
VGNIHAIIAMEQVYKLAINVTGQEFQEIVIDVKAGVKLF